jgi:hypothetical protein
MRVGGVWIGLGAVVVAAVLLRPVGVIVAIVAVASATSLILASRAVDGDLAFRILSFSSRALPDERGDWSEAMLGELDCVSGRRRRLRFALGCARAALLSPRPGAATKAVPIVVATTAVAITGLFLYTRNRLLGASHPDSSSQRGVLGISVDLLFLGVVAASALTALLRSSLTPWRLRAGRLYGAVGGVVVGGVALTGSLPGVAVQDVNGLGTNDWFLLAALAATLAAGVAAAWSSHDARAGKEAGWWAGAIGGAILFIGLVTLSYTNITWFTHDPASLRAFHAYAYVPPADQMHYKTIGAFILKSNLENAAMIGLLVLPLFGFALGALGGATSKIRKAPARVSPVPS